MKAKSRLSQILTNKTKSYKYRTMMKEKERFTNQIAKLLAKNTIAELSLERPRSLWETLPLSIIINHQENNNLLL